MPTFAVFAAALMLAAGMAPVCAQTPEAVEEDDDFVFDRACMDDYGRDLCDQDVWAEIVTRFGLEPAELVQRRGMRGVRVFTVDGYSNDMPAVSILATGFAKNGGPENAELEVRRQSSSDESNARPAILKREAWSGLYDSAEYLQDFVALSPERQPDEDSATQPDSDDESRIVTICLHAWVTVTESLTDEGVVRRIRNACGLDPVFEASFAMSGHALRGFPHCNHLDPANYRNESTQLARCFALDGADRAAAGDVATIHDASLDVATDLEPYLAPDVRLALPDRAPVSGASKVAAALADPAFKDFGLYAGHLVGETDRVIASGWLDGYAGDDVEYADVELTWRRSNSAWRIAAITIGPFKIDK